MSELETFAKSIVKAASTKLSPITFLSGQVREMPREDVDQLAVAYLLSQVKNRQRGVVRVTERSAQITPAKERVPKRGTAAYYEFIERPEQAWRKEADAREVEQYGEFQKEMSEMFDQMLTKMKMNWTQELLDSRFALGDGTEVLWGEATRENHEYRLRLHKQNALAGMEGAARHQQAIETLDSTGASTLYEAVKVAA